MEKFFINILDVIKYLEVKAQEKSQRKKYWVLGNQYLQPVDDVDDEKLCLDSDFKTKARCVYRAARSGMKEGMLTGAFLGGFYGVIKNLNQNLGNALMPSSLLKARGSEEEKNPNATEKNETDLKSTELSSSNNNNNQAQSDFGEQTFIRDSALKNKKRGKSTFTKSEQPDRGNSNNELKRPNSAGQSANYNSVENVRPNTVMNVENNTSKLRGREKVEIVGYAFVETLESRDSENSGGSGGNDSDKRKRDSQKKGDESELQSRSQSRTRLSSDQGRSSGSTYPINVLETIKDVQKKKKLSKKDGDRSKVEEKKLSSDSSHESYPAQVFQETKSKPWVEEKKTEKKSKGSKGSEMDNHNYWKSSSHLMTLQHKQKTISETGKMGFNKGMKKNWSKASRLTIEPAELKDSRSESKHSDKSKKIKNRLNKSEKGNKHKKQSGARHKVFDAFYDNIFMPKKISKSILVDADGISNGYSLSLNNDSLNSDSLNSDDEFDPLSDSNFNILDASGQRLSRIIGQSRGTLKDDDSISYSQKKRLAFVEPEIFSLSDDPSLHLEPSAPSITKIQEDSSNSESIHSMRSTTELGQASPTRRTEDLEPARRLTIIGPTSLLSGYTSPSAVGDTAAASFVQNDGLLNKQEFFRGKTSGTEIVGTEFTGNKVRSVKESAFSSAPKSGYILLKHVSDSLILLSACNCAVVLGVLCAVVSTTKASLSSWSFCP